TPETFEAGPLRALERSGIPCLCMNNFFPASFRLTGPEADHAAALAYAERALSRASVLGADRVVFGSSGARNVPDGFPIDRARNQLVQLLAALAPLARRRDITIVIEPLNRIESNIVNTLEEGLALARAVNDPAVACLVDFYHAGISGDPCASIDTVGPLLRHVHMARTLGRSMPVLADEDAYRPFFSALRAVGYDETISLEAFEPGGATKRTAHALSLIRTIWAES
ncbi:MAG: sugar phosphate isomerase/epimerase, partial [Clostridia bacterium]|nr:sugar phosphate isomerase/epimerase [Clostridia bacterium]